VSRVLEHHTKALLRDAGFPVPEGGAARSSAEAAEVARRIGGPVVVKALVPAGKRGKAGAVRFAGDPDDAAAIAAGLLGTSVGGYPVDQVLVEARIQAERELYLSLLIDRDERVARLLVSAEGGVEIEDLSREQPDAVVSRVVSPGEGLPEFMAREVWAQAGVLGAALPRLGRLTARLWDFFVSRDAYLLEINPLMLMPDGDVIAAGAVLAVDDGALFRQPGLSNRVLVASEKVWRPLTELEEEVNRIHAAEPYRGSARYLELDGGDIGFLCGGGGASLLLFDNLLTAGGRPANYAEVGGNPTETKVAGLARVVASKPGVRGLFVAHNITNNTQVDVVARGVVQGLRDAGIDPRVFPVVAREAGLHDEEGRRVFEEAGIRYLGAETSLSQAAREMVRFMASSEGAGR
jgi:succinyl-CoA synthetase beta subunit